MWQCCLWGKVRSREAVTYKGQLWLNMWQGLFQGLQPTAGSVHMKHAGGFSQACPLKSVHLRKRGQRHLSQTCWRKMWDNETVEPLLPPLLLLLSWLCDPLDPRRSKQSLVSPHWIIRGMHPCSESVCLRLHQWSVMQNVLLLLAQFLLHFFFFKIFYFPLCNMLIFWILMSLFLTYLQYVYLYHCYLCLSLHRRANNVFWTDCFTGLSLVVV